MIKIIITSIILMLFSLNISFSQTSNGLNSKYGGYVGFNLNTHSSDFARLPGIPNCCKKFEGGDGTGINLGVLYEYKIAYDFWIGTRLGIMTLDGTLSTIENTTLNTTTGSVAGEFEHIVEASFTNIGFEPTLIYNPFDALFLSFGGRIGSNITSTFSQVERIISPAGQGTFVDSNGIDTKKRTRNENSGDLQDVNALQLGMVLGLSYELPLNKSNSLRLSPEISYYMGMADMVQDSIWKVNSLRGGIAIKYVPQSEVPLKEIFEKIYDIDTIRVQSDLVKSNKIVLGNESTEISTKQLDNDLITIELISRTDTLLMPIIYKLSGDITAVGVNSDNQEIEIPQIKIEEFISNRLDPLLNYVFFDDNSSEISSRYAKLNRNTTSGFDLKNLFRDSTLAIYHNILNIIGKRLTENPTANITLIGCNSDYEKEEGNLTLSENRAMNVKKYLAEVWSIDANRIKIEAKNLSTKASTPKTEKDKIEENRRVEVYSDNNKILEPIFIEKIDRISNPPIIRFKNTSESDFAIRDYKISAYQKSEKAKSFIYDGKNELISTIDWNVETNQNTIPKLQEPIYYNLYLKDVKENEFISNEKKIKIDLVTIQEKRKEMLGDFEIERFSLILFDFDKANIDGNNKNIIEFIKNRIKTNSEIEIIGYTDRTGEAKYNKNLSTKRSENTKKALGLESAIFNGLGSEVTLYNNNLPEGRFYCRTVNVKVKTKVN